jgi:hypothetical protein
MIYHSLFHAVMSYRIIYWGNSSHSTQVFKCKKKKGEKKAELLWGMVAENLVETCSKN